MEDVYKIMSLFRRAKSRLNEEDEKEDDSNDTSDSMDSYKKGEKAIPYTPQDQLYQDAINTCKAQFGASFGKNPMLYYPKDDDIVLSGVINGLNNSGFQFRLRDPSGCGCMFICNSFINLTVDNLHKLNVMFGCYQNWKQSIETQADYKPMGMSNNGGDDTGADASQQAQQTQGEI